MSILQTSDFNVGNLRISQQASVIPELQESIDRIQDEILTDLLGVELKEIFESEYVDPIPDKWNDLVEGKTYNSLIYPNIKIKFKGVKEALKYFTYVDFISKDFINTEAGNVLLETSNTEKTNNVESKEIKCSRYNKGVNIYQDARDFMYKFRDDYPNWRYSQKSFKLC